MKNKLRYYFWHNPLMCKLEGWIVNLSSWIWTKRWGDRDLYRKDQKKGTQSKYSVCLVVACEGGSYGSPFFLFYINSSKPLMLY